MNTFAQRFRWRAPSMSDKRVGRERPLSDLQTRPPLFRANSLHVERLVEEAGR